MDSGADHIAWTFTTRPRGGGPFVIGFATPRDLRLRLSAWALLSSPLQIPSWIAAVFVVLATALPSVMGGFLSGGNPALLLIIGFATFLALLLVGVGAFPAYFRHRARRLHLDPCIPVSSCLRCGYDLLATPRGARCPECGAPGLIRLEV